VRLRRSVRGLVLGVGFLLTLTQYGLPCAFAVLPAGQVQPPTPPPEKNAGTPASSAAATSAGDPQTNSQSPASITGTVVDQAGAIAVGALVRLTRAGQSQIEQLSTDENGQFSLAGLPPGPFQLSITAPGFQTKVFSGSLEPGQAFLVPKVTLSIAPATTDVQVGLTTEQVAEQQIHEQEKQRVFGIIPNFYVTYVPNAAPLAAKQKFQLAWKSAVDPVTILGAGATAGAQQATDQYTAYGQGVQGYAKRFGAAYADAFIGTFIDGAVLTSLFKQDPRYFYQGTGTTRSRILHALGNGVIRKGDNGRAQPNYSGILSSFVTGAISYTYYPSGSRSAGLLVQNAAIGIAGGSLVGLVQEFVLKRYTSHANKQPASPPQQPNSQ